MKHCKNLTILGIETSCDETGMAFYQTNRGIIHQQLYTQIDFHRIYGGVIPELASRTQLEKIGTVLDETLQASDIKLGDIDAIGVTNRPGLPGSLLVGTAFAKALAWALDKPIIGINHLEGHIFSAFLEHDVPFPHIAIAASGGHTSVYYVEDFGTYKTIGSTKDDAAGEAFDKIAKLMDLGYPGGPIIEKMAEQAGFVDHFHYPRTMPQSIDFSFSGLKTAILYHLIEQNAYSPSTKTFLKKDDVEFQNHVASSFLVCVGDMFIQKLKRALAQFPQAKAITFVGGCACNRYLKRVIAEWSTQNDLAFFAPSPKYCTDNGAMIAFVAHYRAQQEQFNSLQIDIMHQ